jgi:hypothetical protein
MSSTFSVSESTTFTATHARKLAAKVATDLKRMQRFYYLPPDAKIAEFESEAIELMKNGVLGEVTYGFRRNDQWIEPTLRYTARDLAGMNANDDDPGRIRPGANIQNASFYSYLSYSTKWSELTVLEKAAIQKLLPFARPGATEPTVNGYFATDLVYSAGGKALDRATVRSY